MHYAQQAQLALRIQQMQQAAQQQGHPLATRDAQAAALATVFQQALANPVKLQVPLKDCHCAILELFTDYRVHSKDRRSC